MSILAVIGSFILYSFATLASLLVSCSFVKYLTPAEIMEEDEKEKKMIEQCNQDEYVNQYLDEYNLLESNSNSNSNNVLKETSLTIPFLKTTIVMYYENGIFYYYSNTDVLHKYLNVVCRKFVIENNAKELYINNTTTVHEPSVTSTLFVTKPEKNIQDKEVNKFIRAGNLLDYEYKKNKKEIKTINIMDFMKLY